MSGQSTGGGSISGHSISGQSTGGGSISEHRIIDIYTGYRGNSNDS